MKHLKALLVANRGEIACRLLVAAKKLGIRTVALYTESDSRSGHVGAADEAVLLTGEARAAYIDGEQIIAIAKSRDVQAIIPGYGFLSEDAAFARAVAAAGLIFVGPSPEAIESFGLKHTARDLALTAGVPVVPGSPGLVQSEDAAVEMAQQLGYPVMLKATAGGGGMGLMACTNEAELRQNFQSTRSRGESLFSNAGVFLERYYPDSHHIEVQVFGNGQGRAISIGERECSIQRRNQKVVEECPSPFVTQRFPELRAKLTEAAVALAESVQYGSAGTVEYLVNNVSGDFFFLEMNTRLQVEHGITEMCYNVDLVELMLQQADCELGGCGGILSEELEARQAQWLEPCGHAIEARVYAENPARGFAPSPGLLQEVRWHEPPGTRIDTWIRAGLTVSPDYDPLLSKIMYHASTRSDAVAGMAEVLAKSVICGPPVNLDYLSAIVDDERFRMGHTITKFLDSLDYAPAAIDVISGGSYTLVEDYPGRPSVGHGFGHAGPMDPIAFQAANILVGNPPTTEALEITLTGPELLFLGDAMVVLCGPPVPATLDGQKLVQWMRVSVQAGQTLRIGKLAAQCRVYLAVYGGFLNIASWFDSKSTNPLVGVGGYQGRPLRAGDFLHIVSRDQLPEARAISMPRSLIPQYSTDWVIQVMPGPYETGYLTLKDIEMCFSTTWRVSHNAARGGIRLIGPRPEYARGDGGDGGSHPSNVFEYGYPMGGLNWTGDEPVLFPVDCPDFGGFLCSLTVIRADFYKLGQLRAGDTLRFRRVNLDTALACRRRHGRFLQRMASCVANDSWDDAVAFDDAALNYIAYTPGQDVVASLQATESQPKVTYRSGGDDYLLVEYGDGKMDLEMKCRSTALKRALESATGRVSTNRNQGGQIYNLVACGSSLAVWYNGLGLERADLIRGLIEIEHNLGDMRRVRLPIRRYRLPVTFRHRKLVEMLERYTTTQRSTAAYLPDPFAYAAEFNGLTPQELKEVLLAAENVVLAVGFIMALPIAVAQDPRHRIRTPKMNPSRNYTPAGCFAHGGSSICLYQVDGPGGYMPLGMSLPTLDLYGTNPVFQQQPWLIQDMDTISFFEVSGEEYDRIVADLQAGRYHFQVEDGVFDMAEYHQLQKETGAEMEVIRQKQLVAATQATAREKALLDQWLAEKDAMVPDDDEVARLLQDATIQAVEAPTSANVWKVLVEPGTKATEGQTLAILEAMKMEINVDVAAAMAGATVVKVLIQPGGSVHSGQPIVLLRQQAQEVWTGRRSGKKMY
ncbi:bifunctional urea carboxylase/allophanate hydrolase [Aspergillus fijiensis CBS 313.89]|uniref:Putative urea amidolyase n=1 Tax=Aspergillus fijiensis CBS 313.89 TaxID=1448319 RepID=A0A8G1S0L7_9EURO|nr:putative urea amidolyase [Aspergillus fijiensis CBS 313.89]RAK82197.1 putative urea amidolyase [Aspergillus fijiensis CBS 313.89]